MSARDEFQRAIAESDVKEVRRLWQHIAPQMPQPESDDVVEITMRHAQTQSELVPFKVRAYAHRWLTERELPSGLPDDLKPSAERLFPVLVGAVGISINTRTPEFKPAAVEIRRSMEDAVSDAYAEGREDPAFVTLRMKKARQRAFRALFGRALPDAASA